MKDSFSGYHRPNEDEFSQFWETCLFVVDSNILLSLYRYPEHTRESFLGILEGISARLWIPHQVGLEYGDKRLDTIAEQSKLYDRTGPPCTQDKLDDLYKTAQDVHPLCDLSRVVPSEGTESRLAMLRVAGSRFAGLAGTK